MSKELEQVRASSSYVIYTVEQALWDNKLITWNGDELMTEEINDVFLHAAMEN